MRAVSKTSHCNHRRSRGNNACWKSLSPSLSSSASQSEKLNGSFSDARHLRRQEANTSTDAGLLREQSLLSSLGDSLQKPSIDFSVFPREPSRRGLPCATKPQEVPLYLRFLFVFIAIFKIDKILERVVCLLEKTTRHYPSLLHFEFVRELLRKEEAIEEGPKLIAPLSSEFSKSGSSSDGILSTDQPRATQSEKEVSAVRILSSTTTTDDSDEWGHFADFHDDSACVRQNDLAGPCSALVQSTYWRGSLCALVKTKDDNQNKACCDATS